MIFLTRNCDEVPRIFIELLADFLTEEGILDHLIMNICLPSLMNTSSENPLVSMAWATFFRFEFHLRVALNLNGHLILMWRLLNVDDKPF